MVESLVNTYESFLNVYNIQSPTGISRNLTPTFY